MKLSSHRYGKARVRVVKILRDGARHTVVEADVQVLLEGNFETSYTEGDNSKLVATDTVKNTINVLSRDHLTEEMEKFALHLGQHFVGRYAQVERAHVEIRERVWERIGDHNHSFTAPGSPVPWVKAVVTAEREELISGVSDWLILKSAESGFSGYPRCEFTTLPETDDRIFATSVTAGWRWARHPADFRTANAGVRSAMLRPFCDNFSPSVQATMAEMAEAAFAAMPEVDEISLALPNKHCHLINLQPFGLDNPNLVFTATDEPHGQIEAVFRR
jgi:urate oxidase